MAVTIFTPGEIRAKLDRLIEHVEARCDYSESEATTAPTSARRKLARYTHEHMLGRLHGLSEARELLDLLDGA